MEREVEFREYLAARSSDDEHRDMSVALVNDFMRVSGSRGNNFPEANLSDIKHYTEHHIAGSADAFDRIVALARYCRFCGHEKGLTYLLTMLGTSGVLESMESRMRIIIGDAETEKITRNIENPPLGSPYEAYPKVVESMLDAMQRSLPEKTCRRILAGNHHAMPIERFEEDRKKYAELGSIDAYLAYRHERMIEAMQACLDTGQLWFETKITHEVIEFVRSNKEIQAGVRKGNIIYITKIPYDTEAFLKASDPREKRFHACHCPFVRSSIADGSVQVSPMWCYCTGGFKKLPFDVIFGRELEVEMLETVLGGDERCRSAITLPAEAIPDGA